MTNGIMGTIGAGMRKPFGFLLIVILGALLIVLIPFGAAFLILLWTGEILRCVLSFGRHKPKVGISVFLQSGWQSELLFQVSMYLGIAFWLLILVITRNL